MHQIPGRVLGVGVDVDADPAADSAALQAADQRSQLVGTGGGVDIGQFGQQWSEAPLFDGVLVEEAGVQVADAGRPQR
jgi:hypothetical protein